MLNNVAINVNNQQKPDQTERTELLFTGVAQENNIEVLSTTIASTI